MTGSLKDTPLDRHKLIERLHGTVCQCVCALNTETYMLAEARWRDLDTHLERIQNLVDQLTRELRQILEDLKAQTGEHRA